MILYHYPSGGLEGSESLNDMETFTNASRENYERVVGILLKDTNLTMEKYLKMSERDLYLTPKEAKKLKVVHDIY